jgi:hypothetical protein
MSLKPIRLRLEAELEIEEAFKRYRQESESLADRFSMTSNFLSAIFDRPHAFISIHAQYQETCPGFLPFFPSFIRRKKRSS